jgi:hypothetical protein
LYRQAKKVHTLKAYNLQLREQMLDDRRAFERAKQETCAAIESADQFHIELCRLLELPPADKDNYPAILESISRLIRQENRASTGLSERLAAKKREVEGLRRLHRKSEAELVAQAEVVAKLTRKVDRFRAVAEALHSDLSAHLQLTQTETVQESLAKIQEMWDKLQEYQGKMDAETNEEVREMRALIARQSEMISGIAQSLGGLEGSRGGLDGSFESPRTPARSAGFVNYPDKDPYDDLRNTIWLARTRDRLSLERQIGTVQNANIVLQRMMNGCSQFYPGESATYL